MLCCYERGTICQKKVYEKGSFFAKKWYKRVSSWTSGAEPPRIKIC